MSNHAAGHNAEVRAAEYLKQQGFEIVGLNWKTRYCEIDIVAQKNKAIYFVEVKYRRTTNFGHGYDYITPKKLKQMRFAAELWVYENDWADDYQLAVVSMDGKGPVLLEQL